MDSKTIGFGIIIGVGVYFLTQQLNNSSSGGGERFFHLPNGNVVPESALPQYGYTMFQGRWIPQQVLQNLFNQTNAQSSGFNFNEFTNNLQNFFGSFEQLAALWQQFNPTSNSQDLLLGDPGGQYGGFV